MDENAQQPISDDQELAKVLAGVSNDIAAPTEPASQTPVADPVNEEPAVTEAPVSVADPVAPMPVATPAANNELDEIKLQALKELRPLVDKLDVAPEERFDTYLLLLRSTDDKDLIAPAHEAAKNIADEARRAQALLDIIKEIDFLNQKQ